MTDNNNNNIHISNFIRLGELDIFMQNFIQMLGLKQGTTEPKKKQKSRTGTEPKKMINSDFFGPVGPWIPCFQLRLLFSF